MTGLEATGEVQHLMNTGPISAMRTDAFGPTLRELFDREGTDKGEYAKTYEILLRDIRLDIRNLLEIGIGSMLPGPSSMLGYAGESYRPGASLRAWKAYFSNAHIVGIDIQPDTQLEEERIQTYLCDSTDANSVERLRGRLPVSSFQIIVDDGSHHGPDQLATLKHFWPMLDDGGFYFIEDIHPGTLLFEKPSAVEAIIGGCNYFSVLDWSSIVGQAPPRRTLSNLIRRLLRRPRAARPLRDEWKLLVIRKRRSSRS